MRLRLYLILMAIAILLPVIGFSSLALSMLENAGRETALRELHEKTTSISLLVERELYGAEAALRVLKDSQYLLNGDMGAFYRRAQSANRGANSWTVLLDENGQQLVNTIVPFGTKLPGPIHKAHVDRVLAEDQTTVGDVVPDPIVKRLVTSVNVPVYLRGGKRYVLAMAFNTDHFNRLIKEIDLPANWLVAIVDGQGKFIARSMNEERLVGKPARPELFAAARRDPQGMIRHSTLEGVEVYDAYRRIGLSDWFTAVAAPVNAVEAAAVRAVRVAGLGMLAGLALALLCAFVFGGTLVRSIANAARAAVDLGQEANPEFPRSRIVEINALYNALDEADKLLTQAKDYRAKTESERHTLLLREQAARRSAEDQNRAKDQFLAMLGHELRNPLAPISMAAQLLRMPNLDTGRLEYTSEVITRQVDHMKHLVDELLDVSRVTRGLVTLNRRPVDISSIVAGAAEQVRPLIESRGHRLLELLPPAPVMINGDATRLIQVMANLLSNAAKYTPQSGEISVEVKADEEIVTVIVRDNGMGIDTELLPRVFDLFSQGERTSERAQGGLGLGLALVKSLVALHDGRVAAYSGGPNQGSTFIVELPRLVPGKASNGDESFEPDMQAGAALRILVVDDNVDAATSLAMYLAEAHGHMVSISHNGEQALRCAQEESPEVLILDIGLPDMDGFDLARRMRQMPALRDSLFIALTGYGQEQDRMRSEEAGFRHHLSKPADPNQLASLLAAFALRSRRNDSRSG